MRLLVCALTRCATPLRHVLFDAAPSARDDASFQALCACCSGVSNGSVVLRLVPVRLLPLRPPCEVCGCFVRCCNLPGRLPPWLVVAFPRWPCVFFVVPKSTPSHPFLSFGFSLCIFQSVPASRTQSKKQPVVRKPDSPAASDMTGTLTTKGMAIHTTQTTYTKTKSNSTHE